MTISIFRIEMQEGIKYNIENRGGWGKKEEGIKYNGYLYQKFKIRRVYYCRNNDEADPANAYRLAARYL